MAKRTRRNLSDPTIKRIVKSQTDQSTRFISQTPQRKAARHSLKRLMNIVILLAVVISGVYLVYSQRSNLEFIINKAWNATQKPASPPSAGKETPPAENLPHERQSDSGVESTSSTSQESSPDNTAIKPVARRIQVEILNGCGVNGLAEKLTRYLRQKNIDVVSTGNYLHFQVPETHILDRLDHVERMGAIADLLGLPASRIKIQKDTNLQLDATIILGADYKQLKPFSKQGGP